MSKNIIIAILAISIGGLVTVIINQKKKIAQDDKMSEYYLDFHSQENFWFAKKMIADIESEVNDQGKLVNAGLIDTINWMLDQHEALLRDSSQTFSEEQAIAYSNSLEKMLLGMVRGKVKDNNPYWYPKTDWNSYPSSSDRIWRMMQLERNSCHCR